MCPKERSLAMELEMRSTWRELDGRAGLPIV